MSKVKLNSAKKPASKKAASNKKGNKKNGTKRVSSKKIVAKKTITEKTKDDLIPHANKRWEVECTVDGPLGRFASRQQAIAHKNAHVAETGHKVLVIGNQ